MKSEILPLFMILLIVFTFSSNCISCCVSPGKIWYNVSVEPAKNVTIDIYSFTIGDGQVNILDSEDDNISISVSYLNEPRFMQYRDNDNLSIYTGISYPGGRSAGVGADVYVYIPENATYALNLYHPAGIKMPIENYSKSNVTIVNDIRITGESIHDKIYEFNTRYQYINSSRTYQSFFGRLLS